MTLFAFLNDHYLKEHKDVDRSEDEQLPFKTVIMQPVEAAIVPGIAKGDFTLSSDFPIKVMTRNLYTPQQHLSSIFHPLHLANSYSLFSLVTITKLKNLLYE